MLSDLHTARHLIGERVRALTIHNDIIDGVLESVTFGEHAPTVGYVREDSGDRATCVSWTRVEEPVKPAPPDAALPQNPKDRFGIKKVSLSKVPAVAIAHEAHAMMDGANKYGPYNWREKSIITSIYIDACRRHIDAYFDARERNAPDSEVHHLGHARACLGIILDAEATGNLIDDRPVKGMLTAVHTEIAATIERRNKEESK